MGFFALTIMRRWRKWVRVEAGMRRLFEKLSKRNAVHRWKQAARLDAFQATLQRLVTRRALNRWAGELQRRAALEKAVVHYSRSLVSKVGKRFVNDAESLVARLVAISLPGQGLNRQAISRLMSVFG